MKLDNITYRSAVGITFVVAVALAVFIPILTGVRLLQAEDRTGVVLIAVTVFTVLPILGACFPCRYTLTDRGLLIQCGIGAIIEEEIAYEKITDVSLSWNLLAAPALSLKRVKIKCEGRRWNFALVSPTDRHGFIAELNRRRALRPTIG